LIVDSISTLPSEALDVLRETLTCKIVSDAISGCKDLPVEIIDLSRETFKITHAFKHASCSAVDMTHLSANKLDLTGLRIRKPGPGNEVREHRVDLHYAKISDKLAALARLDGKTIDDIWNRIGSILLPASDGPNQSKVPPLATPKILDRDVLSKCFGEDEIKFLESIREGRKAFHRVELSADIPGALDLRHAEIDQLYLSDGSFRDPHPKGRASDHGIVLDYAKITKLYVARGPQHQVTDARHNGFPVPVSLLKVSVQGWFLEELEGPGPSDAFIDHETATAEPYLDLLDNDRTFSESSYLAIEKSLRDRGLEDEANQVFVAGRYRDTRVPETTRRLALLWMGFRRWMEARKFLPLRRLYARM